MKILLTGASGFIGNHTRKALLAKGYKVFVFRGDVRKIGDWKKNLENRPFTVIHLAAVKTESRKDFEVNTKGTENFFKAVEKSSYKTFRFILVSSQAVYIGQKPPFKETMALKPKTTYGISKLKAEHIAQKYGEKLGIRVIILRYSPVLGAGVRTGSNMSGPLFNWTKEALLGQPIQVFQNGEQTRDYVHVNDAVSAIILSVEKDLKGIFNVGGGKEIRLLDFAKWIKKVTQSNSRILRVDRKATVGDPKRMFSDISKLEKFGWKPRSSAKDAINEFVKSFQIDKRMRKSS